MRGVKNMGERLRQEDRNPTLEEEKKTEGTGETVSEK